MSTKQILIYSLKTVVTINFIFFQAANQITSLAGLDNLVNLESLHMRENQMESLDEISAELKHLQYINLRLVTLFYVLLAEWHKYLLAVRCHQLVVQYHKVKHSQSKTCFWRHPIFHKIESDSYEYY